MKTITQIITDTVDATFMQKGFNASRHAQAILKALQEAGFEIVYKGHEQTNHEIQTEKSFCLLRMGINSKSRARSYRIRKLSVIDKQGREITIYSIYRALLFFFLQPLLFLYTFLRLNHYLPWTELKQGGGRAWGYVKRTFAGS